MGARKSSNEKNNSILVIINDLGSTETSPLAQ